MNPEEKMLLKRAVDLSEDNNQMLNKLVRAMRWGRLVKSIYWIILIGISVGAFYYVQPYINQLLGVYTSAQDTFNSIGGIVKPN